MIQNREGYPPTFRNIGSACLDVTLAGGSVSVVDRQVTHDLTSSDRAMIRFGVSMRNKAPEKTRGNKYNTRRVNWDEFRKTLRNGRDERRRGLECPDAETNAVAVTELLATACDKHAKMGTSIRAKTVPWWKDELNENWALSDDGRLG